MHLVILKPLYVLTIILCYYIGSNLSLFPLEKKYAQEPRFVNFSLF